MTVGIFSAREGDFGLFDISADGSDYDVAGSSENEEMDLGQGQSLGRLCIGVLGQGWSDQGVSCLGFGLNEVQDEGCGGIG
jgi:hypothetical protein